MKLAIIPARGGSKRIPQKNIKLFFGQPMIAYAINAARECKLFDHIVVSTDCKNIREVALNLGAAVPFTRPAALSDDLTGTGPVVQHAIDWLQNEWQLKADYVCCIYPTVPFLTGADLSGAFVALDENSQQKCFAFSVTRYTFPVQRALTFNPQGDIKMLFEAHAGTRSQDLAEVFHDAGQFYWGKTQAFVENKPMFSEFALPYFLPRSRVMDLDDEEDWQEAELMYEAHLLRAAKLKTGLSDALK
jgi:N-acylneuraminate cytidylyltransferase